MCLRVSTRSSVSAPGTGAGSSTAGSITPTRRRPDAALPLDLGAAQYLRLFRTVFALVFVYAVGITGMALIPGREVGGTTQYMSLFHAFYFFTYTATTTGFGEIPYEFTDEQRLWAIFCVYMGVVAWLYAISALRLAASKHSKSSGLLTCMRWRRLTWTYFKVVLMERWPNSRCRV